jgi:hypothetical protein
MNKFSRKNGLVAAAILIILGNIFYVAGLSVEMSPNGLIYYGIVTVFMVRAVKDFRTDNKELITLKQGFITAWHTSVLAIFIFSMFQFLTEAYLYPSIMQYKQELILSGLSSMEDKMEPEVIDQMNDLISSGVKFFLFITFFKIIFEFIFSALVSVLIAAIMKKENDFV